jgi:hypothetical protein
MQTMPCRYRLHGKAGQEKEKGQSDRVKKRSQEIKGGKLIWLLLLVFVL